MLTLLLNGVLGLVALGGLGNAAAKIPFAQKWVWLVGFGLLAANGVCNALYQQGGVYMVLLPALYPLQSACDITATLALVVGAYSAMNKDMISPHFYSLPTGCAPVAMLAQYVPTFYLQAAFIALFAGFVLLKMPSEIKWLLPFGLLLAASAARELNLAVAVLTTNDLVPALSAAATFLFVLFSGGMSVQIGKTKIG